MNEIESPRTLERWISGEHFIATHSRKYCFKPHPLSSSGNKIRINTIESGLVHHGEKPVKFVRKLCRCEWNRVMSNTKLLGDEALVKLFGITWLTKSYADCGQSLLLSGAKRHKSGGIDPAAQENT